MEQVPTTSEVSMAEPSPYEPYDTLVKRIAKSTGYPKSVIRDILMAVPEALMQLGEGNRVKTPLGVFRMTHRETRDVALPGTDQRAVIDERLIVKLRPGHRLQRPFNNDHDPA